MRVKCRSGESRVVLDNMVVRQEKFITRRDTYWVLHLTDGTRLQLWQPAPVGPHIKEEVVDLRARKD